MATNARVAMGKRLRFEVFERDQFTCQYCGRNPPAVVLEVDHIHPVSAGGTNDIDNLRTSCSACNRGKHKKILSNKPANPMESLRRAQEAAEDVAIGKHLAAALKSREEVYQHCVNMVCKALGDDQCSKRSATSVMNIIREFGVDSAIEWLDIAEGAVRRNNWINETSLMKYFCAIARNKRNGA